MFTFLCYNVYYICLYVGQYIIEYQELCLSYYILLSDYLDNTDIYKLYHYYLIYNELRDIRGTYKRKKEKITT